MRKKLYLIPVFFLLAVLIFSGYKVGSKLLEYKRSSKMYDQVAKEFVSVAEPEKEKNIKDDDVPFDTGMLEEETDFPLIINFEELRKQNSDVIGWINLPDSRINYPVVQGTDNDYYLHTLLDGTYNFGGTIFLDCDCNRDFSTNNNIIYGHNMTDGSMFRAANQFKTQAFYDENPVMYLATPDTNYKLKVFSCFVTISESDAYRINLGSRSNYAAWLKDMKSNSAIETAVDPDPDYMTLMLSTCSYEYDNARTVVLCQMVPYGKSKSVNAVVEISKSNIEKTPVPIIY